MTPEQLKQWREKHQHSQQSLAEVLGVYRETVARWENGTREIPSLLALALEALEYREEVKKTGDTGKRKGGRKHG